MKNPVYEQIQARKVKARLRMLQHAKRLSGNVSQTCRFFGVSRALYYIWKKRYEKSGLAGLRDQPRRPHNIRYRIPPEIVSLILRIREERRYSAVRVSLYLQRHSRLCVTDDYFKNLSSPSRRPDFTEKVSARSKASGCTSSGSRPLRAARCEVRSPCGKSSSALLSIHGY
jgi:transposase-like protein